MGKWSEMSDGMIPDISLPKSVELVKILSIKVAVELVILVGLEMIGKNE